MSARKALVARWLRELRLAGKTRAKTDVAHTYQATFEALGFRAATFQNGVVGAPCPSIASVSRSPRGRRGCAHERGAPALARGGSGRRSGAPAPRPGEAPRRTAPRTQCTTMDPGTHDRDRRSHAFRTLSVLGVLLSF